MWVWSVCWMEKNCFLFGHADAPDSVGDGLEKAIEQIVLQGTTVFYAGYHGNFDRLAASVLKKVKRRHKEMVLMLVIPYHPAERTIEVPLGFDSTFYPPLEHVPRKYAIVRANRYMVDTADSIVCYVNHFGNSRNLLEKARKRNIRIVNLGDGTF